MEGTSSNSILKVARVVVMKREVKRRAVVERNFIVAKLLDEWLLLAMLYLVVGLIEVSMQVL